MQDTILLATLTHYYSQLERRLEPAVNPRHPQVRIHIARETLDLFLAGCDPALAAELEPRRAELATALIDQRQAIDDAIFAIGRRLDRPVYVGPINHIYDPLRRINALIVASAGAVLEYCVSIREQFMPESRVIEAESTGWSELEGRNAVFYGVATTPVLRDVLREAGWQVEATHITIGTRRIEGEQLGLIAGRARPGDPTLADVVYTAADERVVVGLNALHHGPSDFVIGRLTKVGRYQIVLRGNFARGTMGELLTTLAA